MNHDPILRKYSKNPISTDSDDEFYYTSSADDLLEFLRMNPTFAKKSNIVNKFICKYLIQNKHFKSIFDLYNILQEFNDYKKSDLRHIFREFLYLIEYTDNQADQPDQPDQFYEDFKMFLSEIVKEKNNLSIIKELADDLREISGMVYCRLFCTLCTNYPIFDYDLYFLIENFFTYCTTETYAKYMVESFKPDSIIDAMQYTIHVDIINCANRRETLPDKNLKNALKYLIDNGVYFFGNKKVSTILLQMTFKYDMIETFNYLLSVGCRPYSDDRFHNKIKLFESMNEYSIETKDMLTIVLKN